eukprot:1097950-Alexandrium_andersonii.AAC.1
MGLDKPASNWVRSLRPSRGRPRSDFDMPPPALGGPWSAPRLEREKQREREREENKGSQTLPETAQDCPALHCA